MPSLTRLLISGFSSLKESLGVDNVKSSDDATTLSSSSSSSGSCLDSHPSFFPCSNFSTYQQSEEHDSVALPSLPTHEAISPDETDSMLRQELTSLANEDREKVLSDVHCISSAPAETPELIENSLSDLEIELALIDDKKAYNMARSMNSNYVSDPKFLLRFLRADLFDVRKAALRLARHFETKLELFGPDKLVKDIVQDDLDKDTMEALYSGFAQICPLSDRAGRFVNVVLPHPSSISGLAKLRRVFYVAMALTEDENIQRNGGVVVIYTVGQNPKQGHDLGSVWKLALLNRSLPVRTEAIHFVHDSSRWSPMFAMLKLSGALGRFTWLRIQDHRVCSHQDGLPLLQRYGIPTKDNLPITPEGHLSTKIHQERWVDRRVLERLRANESQKCEDPILVGSSSQTPSRALGIQSREGNDKGSSSRGSVVWVPSPNDVLLGRGKASYRHMGNTRFREWVEARATEYDKTQILGDKTRLSMEILSLVHESTGRFLQQNASGGWVQVDDATARKKISHAFRSFRGANRKSSVPDKDATNALKKRKTRDADACLDRHHKLGRHTL